MTDNTQKEKLLDNLLTNAVRDLRMALHYSNSSDDERREKLDNAFDRADKIQSAQKRLKEEAS